jgi:hypothetical protein
MDKLPAGDVSSPGLCQQRVDGEGNYKSRGHVYTSICKQVQRETNSFEIEMFIITGYIMSF